MDIFTDNYNQAKSLIDDWKEDLAKMLLEIMVENHISSNEPIDSEIRIETRVRIQGLLKKLY